MTEIVISGIKPYDGRYELDFSQELTTREWGWIKRLAGYLPLAMKDDTFGDPELVCVLAAIALRRAGRIQAAEVPDIYEKLLDVPFGDAITVQAEPEQEDDAGRPPPPSSSANGSTSGGGSPTSSASSDPRPNTTGTPASDTSQSAPPTSVS